MSLFHSNTQRLIEYWRSLAADGRAPSRGDLDLARFADLAPQSFMVGRTGPDGYRLRLAGAFVSDLHKRDLRGRDLFALWAPRDRAGLQGALESARRRCEALVVTADLLTGGPAIGAEILLAPLAGGRDGPDRLLGLYQPLARLSRLENRPAVLLAARRIDRMSLGATAAPRLRLAALEGRRIA